MSDEVTLRRGPRGLSINAIRLWAMAALAVGTFGAAVIQRGMLGLSELSNADLLQILDSESGMNAATAALVCRFLYCCAVPLYAFLLLEGFDHTEDLKSYVLRTLGLAAVCEIPYNLAISGKIFDLSSRNPAFSVPLALLLLYLYEYCSEMGWKGKLLDVVVTLAAFMWASILDISDGSCMILIVVSMRLFRKRPELRGMAGAAAALLCCAASVYYALSPFTMIAVYAYNGEQGNGSRMTAYLFYPVCLIACAIFTTALQ